MRIATAIAGTGAAITAALSVALPASAGAAHAGGGAVAPAAATAPASGPPSAGDLAVAPTSLLRGQQATVTGRLVAAAGATVRLEVRGGRRWSAVASGTADAAGSFAIVWTANRSGELTVRVAADPPAAPAAASVGTRVTATARLAVLAPVIATWYGPGFYGRHTACGEILTRTLVGVADRTLPCGTPVTVSYDGRTVTVPVVDRGPFSGAATIDLTAAAAQELGMRETVPVGMLALRGSRAAPPANGPTGPGGPASDAGGATAPTT